MKIASFQQGELILRVSHKVFQSVVMNFPETMLLYYWSLRVGNIPNEGAFSVLREPNNLLGGPVWSVFFVPKLRPLVVVFGDPVPPNFHAEGFIALFWIS